MTMDEYEELVAYLREREQKALREDRRFAVVEVKVSELWSLITALEYRHIDEARLHCPPVSHRRPGPPQNKE